MLQYASRSRSNPYGSRCCDVTRSAQWETEEFQQKRETKCDFWLFLGAAVCLFNYYDFKIFKESTFSNNIKSFHQIKTFKIVFIFIHFGLLVRI